MRTEVTGARGDPGQKLSAAGRIAQQGKDACMAILEATIGPNNEVPITSKDKLIIMDLKPT
eukprot:1070983-Alexandrium_andersonii.AAC.1